MAEIQPEPKRSFIAKIFISSDSPRFRAGWRLLLQTVFMIIIAMTLQTALRLVVSPGENGAGDFFIGQFLEITVITLSIYIARRFLDKRSFASLGLYLDKQTFIDVFAGIAITFVLMGFIYLVEAMAGWLTFERFAWQAESISSVALGVLKFLIIFIFVGWNEELLSRGYHLQTLASGINMFWALMLSSVFFGAAHLANPNATWVSAVGIFFAGIFLAYGYIRTGQLWLSIGLHIGWNFFEGVVFGFPVSGLDIYRLIQHEINGPLIWTGGAFGPEAGLIVLPALALGGALIYLYTKNRPRIN